MHERMERFRRRIERRFGGRPGRGARYPEELRAEAVALARVAVGQGESLGAVAAELAARAMNPCPCGHLGDPRYDCRCPSLMVERYRARVSGPLLDRIDLHCTSRSRP